MQLTRSTRLANLRPLRAAAAALLATAALLPAALAPASAQAQGDTSAVAVNTRDGSEVIRLMFQIRRVAGDVVDQSNAAVAVASCEACQTIAVSIQVLLVTGDASIVTPENLALALNIECDLCQTLASAYQFVFGTGGPVYFSAEGNQRIADIRRRLEELRRQDLSIEETQAQVDALADELRDVLYTELQSPQPPPPEKQPSELPAPETTETTPTETAPTTTETTPTETAPTTTETTPTTTETTPTDGSGTP
jgi:putative peptide zinc metalloprotease protein